MPIEPITQRFLDRLAAAGGPPLYTLTPAGARKQLRGLQAGAVDLAPAEIEDREIPVGPTGITRIRIVRPCGSAPRRPVVLYVHGAGWVMGDVDTHDRLIREIAHGTNAVVVFVDYDRAPEQRYPGTLEQLYSATAYVAGHAEAFDVDPTRLAVAGDSVGGNMAAAVSLLCKERGGPAIRFQLLLYPVMDADFETPSYREFAHGPWLTREAMKWFWNTYLPDASKRRHRFASPLRGTTQQLSSLPPALIVTAENDVLRDEGEAYAVRLAEAGVEVAALRCLGTIHDFALLNDLAASPPTRCAMALVTATLQRALGTAPSDHTRGLPNVTGASHDQP